VFEKFKNAFNTKKNPFEEKNTCLVKKLKAFLSVQKVQKLSKYIFDKSLKIRLLPKSIF
jgi:hypothetical protein